MQNTIKFMLFSLTLSLMLPGISAAADQQVYGWELMTQQERNEFQMKMRSMTTAEEREQYRMEHHQMMQERAKEKGVTLPEMPEYRNKNMGPGMGPGMGSGSGMGGGQGR